MRAASLTQPDTRDAILLAAESHFRVHGYAKTTVADIAKACEMSPANVYRFFESKNALFEALVSMMLQTLEMQLEAIVQEQRPAADRLRRYLLAVHEFVLSHYLNESQLHDVVTKAMDEQWSAIDAHIQRCWLFVRRIIEDGARLGEFSSHNLEAKIICANHAMTPFCHPQVVSERFAKDRMHQASLMAEFLVSALKTP